MLFLHQWCLNRNITQHAPWKKQWKATLFLQLYMLITRLYMYRIVFPGKEIFLSGKLHIVLKYSSNISNKLLSYGYVVITFSFLPCSTVWKEKILYIKKNIHFTWFCQSNYFVIETWIRFFCLSCPADLNEQCKLTANKVSHLGKIEKMSIYCC